MSTATQDSALIIVDLQNDFCPRGALAVSEGDQVVDVVNRLMPLFSLVVATQDWHPRNHCSFEEQGGLWPAHCVQGARGAELHPSLDLKGIHINILKAADPGKDAYSGFEGKDESGRSLDEILKRRGVRRVYIVGLATDYCVRATALDALENGYEVSAVTDAMRAVDVHPGDGDGALREMAARGARLLSSQEVDDQT